MNYEDLEKAYNDAMEGDYTPEQVYWRGNWYSADAPLFYDGSWRTVTFANHLLRWGTS